MRIFQTDASGIWNGVAATARPDPMVDGRFLIPAGCVTVEPPQLGPFQAAQYVNGAWQVLTDYRGTSYWLPDGSKHTIVDVGQAPPDNALNAPPPPPPPKVTIVTMRQAQLALLSAGLLDSVEAFIAQQNRAVQITWATASTVERDNPVVLGAQQALNLTSNQVDDLFTLAATL